ncbi:hypothetical protein A33K_12944 [Burkholderia humptydooensis MSMB43]|uniref:Uncharacterized protein n=1 Tax=Burkholderia humptydooensis MSMB43 TaxID=441157 RepID=A0ABN0GB15_9BURK|nr:hypothetical protein A33K_12944 [Burkholderia humptydooensis MSMB43]
MDRCRRRPFPMVLRKVRIKKADISSFSCPKYHIEPGTVSLTP